MELHKDQDARARERSSLRVENRPDMDSDGAFLRDLAKYVFLVEYANVHRERQKPENRPQVTWMDDPDLTKQQIDVVHATYANAQKVKTYMQLHEVSPQEVVFHSLTLSQIERWREIEEGYPEAERGQLCHAELTPDQQFLMTLQNPYDLSWQHYLGRSVALTEKQFGSAEQKRVWWDLGAGTGKNAMLLLEEGYVVLSSDTSPTMNQLRDSRLHEYPAARNLGVQDLMDPNISPGERVHAILIDSAIAHVERKKVPAILERLAAHLLSGGILTISFRELSEEARKKGSGVFQVQDKLLGTRYFTAWSQEELLHMLTTSPLAELYEIIPHDSGKLLGESHHLNPEIPNFLDLQLRRKPDIERVI